MANKYTSLFYSENFLFRDEAVEEARRLRKSLNGQHIKLIIRDDFHEDYVHVNGRAHWFLRPIFFVEVLVHRESKQIPF